MPSNVIAIPGQVQWLGRLDKYGESAGGSIVASTVIIPVFAVASLGDANQQNQGNLIKITDFAASCDAGGLNTKVYLQKSNNGTTWTTVARISLPVAGNYHRSYSKPIYVAMGQSCRVVFVQDTAAGVSVELKGETAQSDVVDV